MNSSVQFILILISTYLLGSIPLAHFLAREFYGVDLKQFGSRNAGVSNLIRGTSFLLTAVIGVFDLAKGVIPLWLTYYLGFGVTQQVAVALASVIAHNWPVFLHFDGGRGILTSLGVIAALPVLNGYAPWEIISFFLVAAIFLVISRSIPFAVLIGIAVVPLAAWGSGKPFYLTLGFLILFLLAVIRRLTAPKRVSCDVSPGKLMLNRLLYDRDIIDRGTWIEQRPQQGSCEVLPRKVK